MLHAAFAIIIGIGGVALTFVGQRSWRLAIPLTACFGGGGFVFYLLQLYVNPNHELIPIWVSAIVSVVAGGVLGGVSMAMSLLALLLLSAAAGAAGAFCILSAAGVNENRAIIVGVSTATAFVLALVLQTNSFKKIDRQRSRQPTLSSELTEAVSTAVLGGYGLVFCVDHWLQTHLAPTYFYDDVAEQCTRDCYILLASAGLLAAVGLTVQIVYLVKKRECIALEQRLLLGQGEDAYAAGRRSKRAAAPLTAQWTNRSGQRIESMTASRESHLHQHMRGKYQHQPSGTSALTDQPPSCCSTAALPPRRAGNTRDNAPSSHLFDFTSKGGSDIR